MIKLKPKIRALLGAMAVLTAGTAHADLLEYSFTGADGSQRTLTPTATYANPTGTMTFALSAGVDRKVRISILNSTGAVVSTKTSSLLGANDRITVGGKEYYGAFLTLQAPDEGSYLLKAEIISGNELPIKVDEFPLIVDTTLPVIDGDFFWNAMGYQRLHDDGKWIVSRAQAKSAGFNGVYDSFSGIKEAFFTGQYVDGEKAGEVYAEKKPATITHEGSVIIGNGTEGSIGGDYITSLWSEAKWTFEVVDKAGNRASKDAFVYMAQSKPTPPEPFGVWDGSDNRLLGVNSLQGFVPYVHNMNIYSNPIKMIYRVKRDEYIGGGGRADIYGGYQWMGSGSQSRFNTDLILHKDDEYMYMLVEAATDGTLMDVSRRYIFHPSGFRSHVFTHSLRFGSETLNPPRSVGISAYVEGLNKWIPASYSITKGDTGGQNDYITKVKVQVEPRPYNQIFDTTQRRDGYTFRANCTIPANSEECTADVRFIYPGDDVSTYHSRPIIISEDGNLRGTEIVYDWRWDGSIAKLDGETTSINEADKTISYGVINEYKSRAWSGARIFNQKLRFVDQNGVTVDVMPFMVSNVDTSKGIDAQLYKADFKFSSVPDGVYRIYAIFEDGLSTGGARHQSEVLLFSGIVVDATPPNVILRLHDGSDQISSLDDITVELYDDISKDVNVRSVNLRGGPANDNVNLTVRHVGQNNYKLEYPVMFPSLKDGESYTLTVEASDEQNNVTVEKVTFNYKPRQISLAEGMDGKLMIPAVTQEFQRSGGGHIIQTEPIKLGGNTVVTGSYDVFATLRSDAQVPLVVNGIRIEPGQTMSVMSQHNFGSSGGRINLPLRPAVAGVEGSSNLLVMTSAPNSPVLVLDVNTWKASAKLSAESWTVRQVVDPVKIYALPEAGVPCRLTTRQSEATAADPIRDPVCLLQWDRTPDEAEQTTQDNNGMKVAGLVGQAVSIGEQPVEYSLYLFSGDGSKVKVGSGSQNLTVTTAYGSVNYSPGNDIAQVNRVIQNFNVNLKQSKGPDCSLTLNADRAKSESANKAAGSTSRACLFEWLKIPDGLTQEQFSDSPALSGSLAQKGDHPLGWRVSIFTRKGTRVTLNEETFNIEAIDPPAPTVELSSTFKYKDNIYMVPMTGNYLGDAIINSQRADLDISISRNTDVLESETFTPGWGATNKVYRRINTDERTLWEETIYKVNAAYNKVPDVKTEAVYRAISSPAKSVRPIVEVDGDKAIDTIALPVRVLIRDQYRPDGGYDANTMGNWKVRLIRQKVYNETEPLTDFVPAENGEAQFSVNLEGVDSSSIRIVAEAVLESPIEGYNRTETSLRPAFLTVLRGGAIGADVQARKLSGQAPFTSVFKLALNDRQDVRATGKVIWETSTDDGKTWEQFTPEDRYKYQLVRTFEKGEYKVRAKVFNINSGAEQYTEVVSVIAYDKPKISVAGPTTLFIGSEGKYTANLTLNGEEIKDNDAVVEWSTDGGKTYSATGKNLTLSSDEVARYRLWTRVRSTSAPAEDSYAYETAKMAVDFVAVKPPRPRVTGPSTIETGKTYTFKADTSLPYRGMDVTLNGFFTLPNGTIVNGDTVEYVPTETDLSQNSVDIKYTVWIEGYRDKGAEASHSLRTRVWQYVWPKFGMQVRVNANVAPATVTASVRAIAFNGKLEEPTYDWDLPKGVVIEDQRQGTLRSFVVNEPGDYTIKVTVRDARGHEFAIEQPLKVGQASPYAVDLQYSGSNQFEREPLDVLLRPYISGGHPRDRIASRTFSVNGAPIDGGGYYVRTTLGAGEHSIKLKITSEMGHEAEGEVNIKVAENNLPTCSLSSRETVGSWIVYANCEDTDGRMKSYQWTVGGELQSISSDRITISKGAYKSIPSITLVGVDDSGGKSEAVTMN